MHSLWVESWQTGFTLETLKIHIVWPNQGGLSNILAVSEHENTLTKRENKAVRKSWVNLPVRVWCYPSYFNCNKPHVRLNNDLFLYALISEKFLFCWWLYWICCTCWTLTRAELQSSAGRQDNWQEPLWHAEYATLPLQMSLWPSWLVWDITAGSLLPCSCSHAKMPFYQTEWYFYTTSPYSSVFFLLPHSVYPPLLIWILMSLSPFLSRWLRLDFSMKVGVSHFEHFVSTSRVLEGLQALSV